MLYVAQWLVQWHKKLTKLQIGDEIAKPKFKRESSQTKRIKLSILRKHMYVFILQN